MQPTQKFEFKFKPSRLLKRWLYLFLMVCMVTVSVLADRHILFLMLLFPIGVVFNWMFFNHVALGYSKSVIGLICHGSNITIQYKDGTIWTGELIQIPWNSNQLTTLQIKDSSNRQKWVALFPDAVDKEMLRQFKVWLRTEY